MKKQFNILIIFLLFLIQNSAQAGWFESNEEKAKKLTDLLVKQCVQVKRDNISKNTKDDLKTEVFAGNIRPLDNNVVQINLIVIFSGKNYLSKTEVQGLCRYNQNTNEISWQPFTN